MFDEKNKMGSQVFIRLRSLILFLAISILLIVALIITVTFINATGQEETARLVNTLGKQRMLTQYMAKEATRISAVYSAKNSDSRVESLEVLDGKIETIKKDLAEGIDRFDQGYQSVLVEKNQGDSGPSIHELGNVWGAYKSNLKIILASRDNENATFRKALIYVNANDARLLELSDNLVNGVLARTERNYRIGSYTAVGLLVFLAGFVIYTLRKFYLFMFRPLGELYSGFADLGIALMREETVTGQRSSPEAIVKEIHGIFSGIKEMLDLIENLNSNISFQDTLQYIFNTFSRFVPYTYIGIAMFTGSEERQLKASYGISGEKHKGMASELVGLTVNLDGTSLGSLLASGKPRVINDLDKYFEKRIMNSYSKIIVGHGIKSSITLPLIVNKEHIGFIFFSSDKMNVYHESHVAFLESVSSAIAISLEKNIFVDELVYSSVLALAKLAEAKDEETGDHIDRMKNYASKFANLLKKDAVFCNLIDPEFLMNIEKFSPMHDIGKVGVPDNILLKPGRLTPEEFEIMKTHPVFGAEVLRKAEENINKKGRSMFSMGIEIANFHHEKWDGTGYPSRLRGEEIPLSARIVAISDVLDALLSVRPYKRAFTFEESAAIILEGRGKHFDPRLVDLFEEHIEEFRTIYEKSTY